MNKDLRETLPDDNMFKSFGADSGLPPIHPNAHEPTFEQLAVKAVDRLVARSQKEGMRVPDARAALARAVGRRYDLPSSESLTRDQSSAMCRHLNVDRDEGLLCLDCGEEVPPLGFSEADWQGRLKY